VNDAPRLQSDWLGSALEEQPISVAVASLMSNDSDPEGDAMTFLGVSGASGGTVSQSGATVNFTPYTNFSGTASFTYQVADAQGAVSSATAAYQVINVNDVPIAAGETIYAQEDQVQYIAASLLTQNDYDADGDTLSIASAYGASHGTVYASGAGVVYVPQANYYGTDQFIYTVSDGRGGTANAMAYLNIASVNDAPTGFGEQLSPMAQGSTLNQSFASLLANDSDPDGDALTISSASSSYGNAYASGGSVFFTPYPNITGSASFNYTVSDGRGGMIEETAQVDVMSTNRAPVIAATAITGTPVNIEGNYTPYYFGTVTASDPDGDALKMQATSSIGMMIAPENPYQGNFIWQWYPPSYANGLSANLNFTVSDQGGLSATTTVHITTLWQTPIVLDVSGQGLSLLNAAQSGVSTSIFDQTATGTTAWIGAGNAFLALDDDGDGIINAQDIIFTDDAPGAETDMDAVQQVYDSSGSGTLDQADTRFADFRVWEDRNQDGIADQAEVQTLAEAGIASVGLTGARDDQSVNGSIVHRTSEFTRTNGTTGTAADVSLGAISVTTSIEVIPTATSTSTVLHSLPNAVPVATTQTQAVTVTTVVTPASAVTSHTATAAQTQTLPQPEAVPASAVATALPEAQTTVASVAAATSLVLADTATTVAAVTVAAASEGQTVISVSAGGDNTANAAHTTPSVSAATDTANQVISTSALASSTGFAATSDVTGVAAIDTPVTTATPAVVSPDSPTAVPAIPAQTASADTAGSGTQTPTDTAATPAAAPPAPISAIDTAPPASTSVDLTANIANQADLLRQAMAAFDPAPSVAAAASATDMLTQTATLAANPISAGDHCETKLAA
ncbi:cadherin-like domain-containing protein, partial [Elstera sp.]|uniref:cadherin-like domain-containing protein n=1 Tax=Elstera sp. TaxID=1916664 RepID=UPI0037C0BB55